MSYSDAEKVNTRVISFNMTSHLFSFNPHNKVFKCCLLGENDLAHLKQHLREPRLNLRYLELTRDKYRPFHRYNQDPAAIFLGTLALLQSKHFLPYCSLFFLPLVFPSLPPSLPSLLCFSVLFFFKSGSYSQADFEVVAIFLPQLPEC